MYKARHSYLLEESFPQPLPLPNKTYSLESDMLFGWRPKHLKPPLPLTYDDWTKSLGQRSFPVVFKGYRAQNSFLLTQDLQKSFPETFPFDKSDKSLTAYNFLNKNKSGKKYGMIRHSQDSLIFDSFFESGNLDRVEKVSSNEYDLFIRPDSNTSGHMHWFYFSVTGFRTLDKVKFNIVNFTRCSPLFRAGMKPKQFSWFRSLRDEAYDWEDAAENVNFGYSKLNKFIESDKELFMLSFEIVPDDLNEKLWIATTVPYTYSRLWKVLKDLQSDQKSYECSHVVVGSLGKSLSLLDIPVVTVTNPESIFNKKIIVVTARVHPSETVGSWIMEGFLRFISSKSSESRRLRDIFDFRVIPMCNPDGVLIGNSRTNLNGNDLNRCYLHPNDQTQIEASLIKRFIEDLVSRQIFVFLDFHAHFCKKGSFIYGPCYPLHDPNYFQTKIIAKLLSERTQMFRYHSSRFVYEKGKNSTARMVMWKELGIVNTFTLETSYFGYLNENRETVAFHVKDLYQLAEHLVFALHDFFLMQNQENTCKVEKTGKRKNEINKTDSKSFKNRPEKQENLHFSAEPFQDFRVPVDKFLPLDTCHENFRHRSFNEMVEIIRADRIEEQLSDSTGSDSQSEGEKELELPKINCDRKSELGFDDSKKGPQSTQGRKMKLQEKFARRIERIKGRMKKKGRGNRGCSLERSKELNENSKLPAIVSSANANRITGDKY